MNKRIRELAIEAGAIHIHGKPKDRALVGYDNIEKFAELIVRECCKVSDEIEPLELSWKTSRFVKLHFGIEE